MELPPGWSLSLMPKRPASSIFAIVDRQQQLEELLHNYPATVQHLAIELGKYIKQQIPDIQETADIPGRLIGYAFSNKYIDTICTTILSQKDVKLGFYKGASLPDPSSLLTGTGKVHKYVAIKRVEDIADPALKELILAAYKAWQQRKAK